MKNFLFLGDSITDCSHCFTPDNLGDGYVKLIAEQIDSCSVVNGGTDGLTFPAICRKWQRSYASQPFDTVSILGGINDVGAVMDSGMSESQIRAQLLNSELALKKLLSGLLEQRTSLILLPEPFLFPYPHYLQTWMGRLEQMRDLIRTAVTSLSFRPDVLSDRNAYPPVLRKKALDSPLTFGISDSEIRIIPLQPALDAFAERHGFAAVTTDGIHLTQDGHQIVCNCILSELKDYSSSRL